MFFHSGEVLSRRSGKIVHVLEEKISWVDAVFPVGVEVGWDRGHKDEASCEDVGIGQHAEGDQASGAFPGRTLHDVPFSAFVGRDTAGGMSVARSRLSIWKSPFRIAERGKRYLKCAHDLRNATDEVEKHGNDAGDTVGDCVGDGFSEIVEEKAAFFDAVDNGSESVVHKNDVCGLFSYVTA
ncbi:hypothetical protein L596_013839 [Steinernema carpocapsae]|uniref:Uncharacterized protein n=1 Tax=Steinernema carpocapsae TaxID=34508 RepID=A0A4U5P2B9_STECR|nr:hypothetical protein L596_013839 [Steinernema carpocapsae]